MPQTDSAGRRLLVTGGTGFLGGRILTLASNLGWTVVGTSRSGGLRTMDLTDPYSVDAVVEAAEPHAVIHTAYAKDVPEMDAVIVDGSRRVAEASARVGARLIHVSSDAVFSGYAGRPYTETDTADPTSGYGIAKAHAERRVLDMDPTSVVVRTSILVGGAEHPGHQERRAARPDPGYWADVVRNLIHVDDLATALIELVDSPATGVLHVAGPEAMSRATIVDLMSGRTLRTASAPDDVARDVRLDSSMALSILTTPIRSVRSTLLEHRQR